MRKFSVFDLIPLAFVLIGMVLVGAVVYRGHQATDRASAYVKVQLCILDVPARDRVQSDIDICYQEVEDVTGVELIRISPRD